MGSLIAGMLADTPYVPSTPVQIGTSGTHHSVPEAGSWQVLIAMLAAVILVGAAVLMFAVRQRTLLLERRRVRRMAETVTPHATPHDTGHGTGHDKPPSPGRVT